jgi:uncharacterized alkaline shock family protein YloU
MMGMVNRLDSGSYEIADEVIQSIAGIAATEVKGVAGMSGGIADGFAELLLRQNITKGVKVEVGEKQAAIDLFIIIEFGVKVPDIGYEVQECVKRAVESMTGLEVIEVNVHIQGVEPQKDLGGAARQL